MAWVDVQERLPTIGEPVIVFGDYTPPDMPLPRAALNDPKSDAARYFGPWSSREWRGGVAIRFWWEEEPGCET
jgi:hypothetical protein